MRALLLDDDALRGRAYVRQLKARGYEVIWAKTYHEACDELSRSADAGHFHLAMLDYNLGTPETGLDVVCYMVSMPSPAQPVRVEIHSNDDVGADLMLRALRGAGISAERKELA